MWNQLAENVRSSANWRRHKAAEFPGDAERNIHASLQLDQLATEIEKITDPILGMRYSAIANDERLGLRLAELETEAAREVGFSRSPSSGADFVSDVLSQLNT